MSYAEQSFPFPGTTPAAFAHIAAREEHQRQERIREERRRWARSRFR